MHLAPLQLWSQVISPVKEVAKMSVKIRAKSQRTGNILASLVNTQRKSIPPPFKVNDCNRLHSCFHSERICWDIVEVKFEMTPKGRHPSWRHQKHVQQLIFVFLETRSLPELFKKIYFTLTNNDLHFLDRWRHKKSFIKAQEATGLPAFSTNLSLSVFNFE